MDEFGLIRKYFAPLAKDKGAFSLTDDAAAITPATGNEIVITKDAIAEGVHFFPGTRGGDVAKKLMRVNLSDMAAMGARPKYYLIALCLPRKINEKWVKDFAKGLGEDQKEYGVTLVGGDTIVSDQLMISMTMLGEVKKGRALRRNGARPGDDIYVSGTIGDSALGLNLMKSKKKPIPKFLKDRYLYPQPRTGLGQKLVGLANAAIDISDGLLADLNHVCEESGCAATINRNLVPLSPSSSQLIEKEKKYWDVVVSGGDDYELLFTMSKTKRAALEKVAKDTKTRITRIGAISKGSGVRMVDENNRLINSKFLGFKHL